MAETYPLLLGGEKKESQETIPVRFPYTGELHCTVSQATNNDLKAAVTKALSGFEKTRRLPVHARAEILHNLADAIHKRSAELIDVMVMEGGKTRKFATTEVVRAEVTVRTSAEEAKRVYGEVIPLDLSKDTEGRTGFLRRFPLGPVAGIVPFNFPLNLACHKLAPAIAAGNSVILKPHRQLPCRACSSGRWRLKQVSQKRRSALSRAPEQGPKPLPATPVSHSFRSPAPVLSGGTCGRSRGGKRSGWRWEAMLP